MTFATFVVKNTFRNKRRTALTILSIGFSLFLLVLFQTFMNMFFNPPVSDFAEMRLAVKRTTTITDQMPISYGDKLLEIPHVRNIAPFHWFGGVYKEPKNFFANFGTDPERIWEVFPEFKVSEGAQAAFKTQKNAAIAGDELIRKYGWKPGDRITLKGSIFPVDLDLEIVGSYHTNFRSSSLLFRWDYMNEAMGRPNTTGMYWVQADSAEAIPGLIEAIDGMFKNTPAETKTETEKSFILSFSSMIGNVQVLMGMIAGVVVFTMLLVAASTMAMTVRERLREVGILKSIGFTRLRLMSLILGESVCIGLFGSALGCLLALGATRLNFYVITMGLIEQFRVTPQVLELTLGVGLGIGFISGIWPAFRASGMTITEAIRRLD